MRNVTAENLWYDFDKKIILGVANKTERNQSKLRKRAE